MKPLNIEPTHFLCIIRLGAQSVTLLSTLKDPTQLRRRQCATRQQHSPNKVQLGFRGLPE